VKRIVRLRYAKPDGTWDCYTCDRPILEPYKAHTAHFIPKAACGAFLKYSLLNLRICCYHCNINLGGNGGEFYRRLIRDEGQEYVDQLFRDKQRIVKAYDHYSMLLEQYKNL
jgi:hypothetical protein